MGNILSFTTAAADLNVHPGQLRRGVGGGSSRTAVHELEALSILAFRALSCEHIQRHEAFRRNRTASGQFQLLSILLCGAIHAKGIAAGDRSKLCGILLCGVMSDYIRDDPKDPPTDALRDLPEGLLWTMFSKLPLDAAVRTSAVSRQWRYLWTDCPKLSFDGDTICGNKNHGKQVYTPLFIHIVNRVLEQCRGKLVEELAIKIELNCMLVGYLDSWVRFAVSSRTKSLVLDLAPEERQLVGRDDRYRFPFHLLDKESICRLQKIHLSFVDFLPPMHFRGFPNLRKLDLNPL